MPSWVSVALVLVLAATSCPSLIDAQDTHEEALTGFDDSTNVADDKLKEIVHAMASF